MVDLRLWFRSPLAPKQLHLKTGRLRAAFCCGVWEECCMRSVGACERCSVKCRGGIVHPSGRWQWIKSKSLIDYRKSMIYKKAADAITIFEACLRRVSWIVQRSFARAPQLLYACHHFAGQSGYGCVATGATRRHGWGALLAGSRTDLLGRGLGVSLWLCNVRN